MASTTSADGTTIAWTTTGDAGGPPLVLVDAAGHWSGFSSFSDGLVSLLTPHVAVVRYDRRGRGGSSDTPPYAAEREAEDLAAVVDAVGGSAYALTSSSGGLVALHAAASGVRLLALVLVEPPVASEEDAEVQASFTADLARLDDAGDREGVVAHFLGSIGMPADQLDEMRGTPSWKAMVAVAPTLVHDSRLSEATDARILGSVRTPALVVSSAGSTPDLVAMATAVADLLPAGEHRSLPGTWHGVDDETLVPVLVDFLSSRS